MMITRDNYEIYFMDYLEGNLEESLMNEFIDFLKNNPDLKAELDLAGMAELNPDKVNFPGKEKLYKEKYDLDDEFNRAAIGLLEGELTEAGKAGFEEYLSRHPEKQKEAALFGQTILRPDQTVVFRKKNKLYHYPAGRAILLWSSRIAAVLMLGFLAYRFIGYLSPAGQIPENQLAVSEEKPERMVPETRNLTEETEIQESVPARENLVIPVKRTLSGTSPAEPLPEKNLDFTEFAGKTEMRIPVEMPEKISGLEASLSVSQHTTALAEMREKKPKPAARDYEERLLADVIKEKTGLNNLALVQMARAGLNLISSVSKEKFSFQTNSEGEITELTYDSRLLAFSIPTNNK